MNDDELSANIEKAWPEVMLRYVGRGGDLSYKCLADLSRVPKGTLYKIAEGVHNPRWVPALRIIRWLPPAAKNKLFEPIGLSTKPLHGDACDFLTNAAFGRAGAEISAALADDGIITRMERASARPFVEAAVAEGERWLAEPGDARPAIPTMHVTKMRKN